jgi:hypothetical protein
MAAGDFYFAINATFRFIYQRWGEQALIDYWRSMGREYCAGLSKQFQDGGLEEVERYWTDYFAAEPDGDVTVSRTDGAVVIDVHRCPAIEWLKRAGRQVMPLYCRHCFHVSSAIAEGASLVFELEGGDGTCHQVFRRR